MSAIVIVVRQCWVGNRNKAKEMPLYTLSCACAIILLHMNAIVIVVRPCWVGDRNKAKEMPI